MCHYVTMHPIVCQQIHIASNCGPIEHMATQELEFSLKDEIIKCPSSVSLTKGQTAGQTNAGGVVLLEQTLTDR